VGCPNCYPYVEMVFGIHPESGACASCPKCGLWLDLEDEEDW